VGCGCLKTTNTIMHYYSELFLLFYILYITIITGIIIISIISDVLIIMCVRALMLKSFFNTNPLLFV